MRMRAGKTPIVNHMAFTDARPTIGGKSTTYNPGATSSIKPPRYISAPGLSTKAVTTAPGINNKRY